MVPHAPTVGLCSVLAATQKEYRSGHFRGLGINGTSTVSPVVPRTIVDREIDSTSSGEMICTIQRGKREKRNKLNAHFYGRSDVSFRIRTE